MAYRNLEQNQIFRQIVERAREEFITHGIPNADLKQIANGLDISRATLYRYIGSRERLAALVAAQILREMIPAASSLPGTLGIEKLSSYFQRQIDIWLNAPGDLAFLTEFDLMVAQNRLDPEKLGPYVEDLTGIIQEYTSVMEEFLGDGSIDSTLSPEDIHIFFHQSLMGLAQRMTNVDALHHRGRNRELLYRLLHCLLESVRAGDAPPSKPNEGYSKKEVSHADREPNPSLRPKGC